MCLNSRQIVNPSRYFKLGSGQPLFIDVPCGCCSECIIAYRNEWRTRSYFECRRCMEKDNGYCLFITLTYKNGCLPHLSDFIDVPNQLDFPCFSKLDIQKFLKRLRTDLLRDGFDVDSNLRYFITCEYGKDIRKTKRPHYHCLFFVNLAIDSCRFSRYVSDAWVYYDSDGNRNAIGLTDGLPYKSRSYVKNNTCSSSSLRKIIGYVSKYVTKDFSFDSLCSSRLKKIKDYDYDSYLLAKPFVRPFHLQSKGFGWDYLVELYSLDYIIKYCTIPMIDSKGVINHVPLPKSLVRKLFYEYSRDNKRVQWFAKPELLDFKVQCSKKLIDYLANRIYSVILDFDDSYKLAEYILFARNRLLNNYVSVYDTLKDSFNVFDGYRNYSAKDKLLDNKCLTSLDFGSSVDGYVSDVSLVRVFDVSVMNDLSFIDLKDFAKYCYSSEIEFIYQKYKAKLDLLDDGRLDLLKLQHRLHHVFKSKLLC